MSIEKSLNFPPLETGEIVGYERMHMLCRGCNLQGRCHRDIGECRRADVPQYRRRRSASGHTTPLFTGSSKRVRRNRRSVSNCMAYLGGLMLAKKHQRFMLCLFGGIVGTLAILTVISQLVMWAERVP